MNAKETIEAIKGMATLEEVKALLDTEKSADKPRKTVVNACEERIGELTTAPVTETPAPAPAPEVEPAKELSDEDKKVMSFNSRVGYIRCSSIEKFAEDFFGEDIKSIKTKDYVVSIVLKSGTKIERRGL